MAELPEKLRTGLERSLGFLRNNKVTLNTLTVRYAFPQNYNEFDALIDRQIAAVDALLHNRSVDHRMDELAFNNATMVTNQHDANIKYTLSEAERLPEGEREAFIQERRKAAHDIRNLSSGSELAYMHISKIMAPPKTLPPNLQTGTGPEWSH